MDFVIDQYSKFSQTIDLRIKYGQHVRIITCPLEMTVKELRKKLENETGKKFSEIRYEKNINENDQIDLRLKDKIVKGDILKETKTLKFYQLRNEDTIILSTLKAKKVFSYYEFKFFFLVLLLWVLDCSRKIQKGKKQTS